MSGTTFAFLYLGAIVAVACIADRRGRSGVGWFFMGCCFTPIFALGFLLCLSRKYTWEDQQRLLGNLPPLPSPPDFGSRLDKMLWRDGLPPAPPGGFKNLGPVFGPALVVALIIGFVMVIGGLS